ncbi:MAG: hypothetical protein JW791_03460 [Nanoarchaeota archaeon]|nr:hypothetical protein [Nanoarchaeota archaeon]
MKAQASFEVLIVAATILLAIGSVIYFTQVMINDEKTLTETDILVTRLSEEVQLIYFLGEGATKIFPVFVPANINSSRTFFTNETINYGVNIASGTTDVFEDFNICLRGELPMRNNFYYVIVTNIDDCVYLDYYEDFEQAGNPPIINSTGVNQTIAEQYDYVCINTTAYDADDDLYNVWAEIRTPTGETINYTLYDTGAWCAGDAGDGVYGANFKLNSFGLYTLVSGWAVDLTGNYASDLINVYIYVSESFQAGSGNVYLNFPDASTKNRQATHSFLVWNNDSVSINYFYEVKEVWDDGWSSAEFCTLLSPPGADFSCECQAGLGQCNATWQGVFIINPYNFTIFSYSFENSALADYDVTATATFKILNGGSFSKSRTLDFIQNIPTAQVYLSSDDNEYKQGIHLQAGQLVTVYVMLIEESNKAPTSVTNPVLNISLPKTWNNITAFSGSLADAGNSWIISWNTPTITHGNSYKLNFTANSPLLTGLTVLNATISSSSANEQVNSTNIHELGIRTVESCTAHSDCSNGRFCNNFMFCEDEKGVGGNCTQTEVYDFLSKDAVCVSNYCRQDVVSMNNWYCTADNNDCTERGFSRDNGYILIAGPLTYTCTNGVWVLS